ERRGLPRSVRTEQAHDFTRVDIEAHVVDDHAASEPLSEVLGDQAFHDRLVRTRPRIAISRTESPRPAWPRPSPYPDSSDRRRLSRVPACRLPPRYDLPTGRG